MGASRMATMRVDSRMEHNPQLEGRFSELLATLEYSRVYFWSATQGCLEVASDTTQMGEVLK